MQKPLLLLLLPFLVSCAQPSAKPESERDYPTIKKEIAEKRKHFEKEYALRDKDSVLTAARNCIFEAVANDIFPQWYGTPWSFYGHTKTPQKGSIACGYFVTTVLKDAGFDIPADHWAQLASETFILKLTDDVKRFRNKTPADVEKYLKTRGDGLYIVGLDCHVGFIYVKGDEIRFVHSNYYQRETGVMAEELATKNPLADSKYRIIGKLLDDEMMVNWIQGKAYK